MEHIGFFVLICWAAVEYTDHDALVGFLMIVWCGGRCLYGYQYATGGPKARSLGFTIAVVASQIPVGFLTLKVIDHWYDVGDY